MNVVLNRVEIYQNSGFGVLANGAFSTSFSGAIAVEVMASAAAHNGSSGFAARSAGGHTSTSIDVIGSMSFGNNGFGLLADTSNARITVGQSAVTFNAGGVASGAVESYGDNYAGGAAFPIPVNKS